MGPGGVEPPTSRLSGVRSNHLSYEPLRAFYTESQKLTGVTPRVNQSGLAPSAFEHGAKVLGHVDHER